MLATIFDKVRYSNASQNDSFLSNLILAFLMCVFKSVCIACIKNSKCKCNREKNSNEKMRGVQKLQKLASLCTNNVSYYVRFCINQIPMAEFHVTRKLFKVPA